MIAEHPKKPKSITCDVHGLVTVYVPHAANHPIAYTRTHARTHWAYANQWGDGESVENTVASRQSCIDCWSSQSCTVFRNIVSVPYRRIFRACVCISIHTILLSTARSFSILSYYYGEHYFRMYEISFVLVFPCVWFDCYFELVFCFVMPMDFLSDPLEKFRFHSFTKHVKWEKKRIIDTKRTQHQPRKKFYIQERKKSK